MEAGKAESRSRWVYLAASCHMVRLCIIDILWSGLQIWLERVACAASKEIVSVVESLQRKYDSSHVRPTDDYGNWSRNFFVIADMSF